MRTKPFSVLRERMTPERRAKNETRVQLALLHLTLLELQKSLGYTEEDIEKDINAVDPTFSDLENLDDLQVSALSRYIQALGGSLKLVANFPDKEIVLAQFE
jgi:hypothetical protein